MDTSKPKMASINLKNGIILVDDSLLEKINQFRWYINKVGYAVNDSEPRKLMHRFIMGYPKEQIDHKNGNKLDNRLENLRICSQSQNMANGKMRNTNKSGFRGVSWNKKYSKWEAYLTKDYKHIFLGYFDDKKEAAKAYNTRALEEFGEFCRLNEL